MDVLDTPVKLNYNNGNNFPSNFVMIAYVFLVISLLLIIVEEYLIAAILLLLTLLAITNRHIVTINTELNFIHDYNLYLGFIKVGKKYPLSNYKYITSLPVIESQHIYSRTSNSTTISNSYASVTFFREQLKGKRPITKLDSGSEAEYIAKRLGERLGIIYFKYDPRLVREMMLGQKSKL